MCRLILFTFLSVNCFQFAFCQDKKLLFIGNSYTNYNDLPQLVYEVANSTGDGFIVSSSAVNGTNLDFHALGGTTMDNINSDNWDYVVIQGGAYEVALTGTHFNNNVAPYAAQITSMIKTNYTCSQPIFYRTWGVKNGDSGITCTNYPWMCTYEGMDDALAANYQVLADANDGLISPVGVVWRYLRNLHSEIELYDEDETHPSLAGSYAAACTFYTIILRKDPTLISYNAGLDPIVANNIREATKSIVYNQLALWKVGEFDPLANFTHVINSNEVTFTNTSSNAESYAWDFGDSNSSTNENPIHTYNTNGSFDVELTVTKCGVSHTYETTINLNSLDLNGNVFDLLKIYPNPSRNIIKVEGVSIKSIKLFNILGKKIQVPINTTNGIIDISKLSDGNYFVEIIANNDSKAIKRIVKM